MKHDSRATGTSSAMWVGVSGTRSITAKTTNGSTCATATAVSPRIFPNTIEYRDTGDTKSSCAKSLWRSVHGEGRPRAGEGEEGTAVDAGRVEPVKVEAAAIARVRR